MTKQLNNQITRLRRYVTAFYLQEYRVIRTRCVDAANMTTEAIRSGNTNALHRALLRNTKLLADCHRTFTEMPSGIREDIEQYV